MEKIPISEVTIAIPVDSLRKLPDRAEFRAKSGQASATVKMSNDTVYVDATCDSLQIMCEYYERLYTNYKKGYEELNCILEEKNETRSNPIKTVFVSLLVGVVIGILLTIIVKLKFKIL